MSGALTTQKSTDHKNRI